MNMQEFFEAFWLADSDSERWELVKDNQKLGIEVRIDNDDVQVVSPNYDDDGLADSFDEWEYDALYTLCKVYGIKVDYV